MEPKKPLQETQDTSTAKSAVKSSQSQGGEESTLAGWQKRLAAERSPMEPINLGEVEKLLILMTKYEVTEVKIGDGLYIAKTIHRGPVIHQDTPVKENPKKPDEIQIDPDLYAAV